MLIFTVLFFVPLQLFLNNLYEFTLSFTQLAVYLLLFSLLGTTLLVLLVWWMPRRIRNGLVLILFALGCLAWLQSVLDTGNYGVLDGSPIQWNNSENRRAFYLDVGLWVVGVSLIIGLGRRSLKHASIISAVLLVTQTVSLVHLSVTNLSAHVPPWWSYHTLDTRNKFAFSDSQNVIFLVVDGFQADVFQQLWEERPGLFDGMKGFTYYPDTVGCFPYTQLAVPVMLTGTYYDNSVPFMDYIRTQFKDHAIPTILKREGFHTEVYPLVPITAHLTPANADNLKKALFRIDLLKDGDNLTELLDIAWFVTTPQPVKKWLYNNNRWFLQYYFSRFNYGGYLPQSERRCLVC